MRSALGFLTSPQAAGDALFGLFLLISLLVIWWMMRVGKPFFDLYSRVPRILLRVRIGLVTDCLLMLLTLLIPVATLFQFGATGRFLLDAENQAIQLYFMVILPSMAVVGVIEVVLIARKLLWERKARRLQRARSRGAWT
ncbi:MAG TPA: hypothetical protein VFU60_05305 [Ktedonobacterales bacterium]|nr:hypothetical protein [Ktedonobacterales bacterium]